MASSDIFVVESDGTDIPKGEYLITKTPTGVLLAYREWSGARWSRAQAGEEQ